MPIPKWNNVYDLWLGTKNKALFNLLKDVYLCGRSVILCGHFTDFAFSMAFSIALTNWALVSPVPELRASL